MPATNFDHATSKRLAKLIGAKPKQCWRNAVLALPGLPAAARYVEGFITFGTADHPLRIAIEHGWVELEGRIIDPTLTEGDSEYFAGVRYPSSTILSAVRRRTLDLPIAWPGGRGLKRLRKGWGGWDPEAYYAAHRAALEACGLKTMDLSSQTQTSTLAGARA